MKTIEKNSNWIRKSNWTEMDDKRLKRATRIAWILFFTLGVTYFVAAIWIYA